ncbi:hypothetical protein TVAG_476790 [Trichomonas vaginalis G3]|uniref:Sister chromatid cohesion protein DCC1 n=1 Tax=Trichomonas vaginalis (strain ATCC PRA-98 / G3) TaxID=412133 RepID=A2DAA2_TRIV3|nr:sister chromatid cohesion protein Dcc1 family [Trichomonas vaginalis G3]EAY22750.1 hypothetical protein TVAG_476790 [Trichomonas vaginalis G3]KAI5525561.1 sister chromatid cohesion protein Dcc1 family [Trichomonas vaginalis G3]|eukprot:XP_001583736.1 hypothetical protein [Trichomonas vaginalis G3]
MDSVEEIGFAEDFEKDQYLLFEMTEDDIQKLMTGMSEAEFVSTKNQPIVLCIDENTYDVKEFDTSNMLLPYMDNTILTKAYSTFELRSIKAPLLSFRKLLAENYLTLEEIGGAPLVNPIKFDDLMDNTLCSRYEFNKIIEKLCVIQIDECVKMPNLALRNKIIDQIIRFALTQSDWRKVSEKAVVSTFKLSQILIDQPANEEAAINNVENLVRAVLYSLSETISNDIITLKEKKIIKHIVATLLRSQRGNWMLKENFDKEIQGLVPPDIKFDHTYTYGVCVEHENGYLLIEEETLPITVEDRFKAIFALHKQWSEHEIAPFFKQFHTKDMHFNEWAKRYIRFADDFYMPR